MFADFLQSKVDLLEGDKFAGWEICGFFGQPRNSWKFLSQENVCFTVVHLNDFCLGPVQQGSADYILMFQFPAPVSGIHTVAEHRWPFSYR